MLEVVGVLLKWKVLTMFSSARLAQSVEHETLNLRVVGSSPTLGDNFLNNFFEVIKTDVFIHSLNSVYIFN